MCIQINHNRSTCSSRMILYQYLQFSILLIAYIHTYLIYEISAFATTTATTTGGGGSTTATQNHSNNYYPSKNQNHYHSQVTPSSFEEQRAAVFKRINERILNAPVGTLTKEMVAEAKYCMEANIDRSVQSASSVPTYTCTQHYDPRNVELLLKRVVDEKRAKGGVADDDDVVGRIGVDWYNCVMRAWMMSIRTMPINENELVTSAQAEQRIFEILHFMVSSYLETPSENDQSTESTSRLNLKNIKPNLLTFCIAYSSLAGGKYKDELLIENYVIPSLKITLLGEELNDGLYRNQLSSQSFERVLEKLYVTGVDPILMERVLWLIDELDPDRKQGLASAKCLEMIIKSIEANGTRVGKLRGSKILLLIESLLDRLNDCSIDSIDTYETMINLVNHYDAIGIKSSSSAPNLADQIINSIVAKEMKLSQKVYSDAIIIWSRVGGIEAHSRVESLLSSMENSSGLSPDLRIYNAVIKMYSLAALPLKAEETLLRIEELLLSGKITVKPDAATYTIVINGKFTYIRENSLSLNY